MGERKMVRKHIVIPVMGNSDHYNKILIQSVREEVEDVFNRPYSKKKIIKIKITPTPYIISNIDFDFTNGLQYSDVLYGKINETDKRVTEAISTGCFTYSPERNLLQLKPISSVSYFNGLLHLQKSGIEEYKASDADILITFLNIPSVILSFINSIYKSKLDYNSKIIPVWLHMGLHGDTYRKIISNFENNVFKSFKDEIMNPGIYQQTCHLGKNQMNNLNNQFIENLNNVLICNEANVPFDSIEDFLVRLIAYEVTR